jgi:hypothetical protein
MKYCFILVLLFGLYARAQKKSSFSIKLNNKEIIKKQTPPETEAVTCTVKKSTLIKKNVLTITYDDKDNLPDWHKVFIINDEQDIEIAREVQKTVSGVFTITVRFPVDFKSGKMKIQTLNLPNDPNQAAVMRLRTFPLATITIN